MDSDASDHRPNSSTAGTRCDSASNDAGRADGMYHCLRRVIFLDCGLGDDRSLVSSIWITFSQQGG